MIKAACIFPLIPVPCAWMILGYIFWREEYEKLLSRELEYATFQNESILYIAMNSCKYFYILMGKKG